MAKKVPRIKRVKPKRFKIGSEKRYPGVKKIEKKKKKVSFLAEPSYGRFRYDPSLRPSTQLRPLFKEYMRIVRKMQDLVRKNVRDIEIGLREASETSESELRFLFDLRRAYWNEFDRWGLYVGDRKLERLRVTNIGHLWCTVDSARFAQNVNEYRARKTLAELKKLQEELLKLHSEILKTLKAMEDARYKDLFFKKNRIVLLLEQRKYKEFVEKHRWALLKGILSPAFIQSLIYQLEKSLEHHHGD